MPKIQTVKYSLNFEEGAAFGNRHFVHPQLKASCRRATSFDQQALSGENRFCQPAFRSLKGVLQKWFRC